MAKKINCKSLSGTPYLIDLKHILGHGGEGDVFVAYNREDPKEKLVCKVIKKKAIKKSTSDKSLYNELYIA